MKGWFDRISFRRPRSIRSAVKEAFDHLPSGVCFFSPNGMLTLCNYTMHRLVYTMTGRDLQAMEDLRGALRRPPADTVTLTGDGHALRFPDGRVWSFSETSVTDQNGVTYTQFLARDVTELDRLSTELEQRNREVQGMLDQYQRIAKNMVDITRQQEILTAKMRVHSKMGNCVINTQRYCAQDCPPERKAALMEIWEETLAALRDEIGQEDDEAPADELIRVAKNCGVEITVTGDMPEDPETAYLLVVAARECLTNTITHARGDRLHMDIRHENGHVTAVITNNGTPPAGEIKEGGGLSSLRRRIRSAGGTMAIQSLPAFALTVTLPEPGGGKGDHPL